LTLPGSDVSAKTRGKSRQREMSAPPIIQDTNRVAVFGSQLLGVLIVIATVLTQQGELHSWRPTGTKTQSAAQEDQNGDKFARLWEDPLEDLPTFQAGALSPSPTPAAQNQGVPAPLASGSVKYTFLWNIVDARPLPEVTERRLRTRYALVSAILADGYLPLRESVLSPLFEAGPETLPAKEHKLIGRFETFRKANPADPKEWPYVSVIWTPKQSTKLPIAKEELCRIKKVISGKDKPDVSPPSSEGDVWFLHHGNSEDLSNFSANAPSASPPTNISFLRATVPLKRLAKPPPEAWASLQKITTDGVLVKSLVDELSLRIPALNHTSKTPRVVVFTESDTTYSRAITGKLADQLKKKNVTLEIYSYLRALDGRPDEPRIHETGEASKSQETAASLLQRQAISETSFGTSQFDYLRRTALDLKGKERPPKSNLVAVGILGSDIYDKMLVLQAVRPALPSAIFFTTDLDALYLERAMEPFTRGLVVASADDLDVNESSKAANDQWKLPLMRDSYQTVLVKHVRNILELHEASKPPKKARIFEIAAGKRVELTDTGMSSWALWCLAQPWFNPLIFLPALLNAFLILWAVTTRKEEKSPSGAMKKWPMKKWAQRVVYGETILAGLGLLFLFVMLIFSKLDSLFGEPLSLGISIWPSVMIRLLAFAVAILLLCVASHSFVLYVLPEKDRLKEALGGDIQILFTSKEGESLLLRLTRYIRRIIRRMTRYIQRIFGRIINRPKESVEPDADSFDDFFDWSILRCWVVIISILYLVFSFVLFWLWPPMVPARGGPAFLIEKIVLALGVALYIVHLIFCLVLHFNAGELLHRIRKHFQSEDKETAGTQIDRTQMLTSLGTLTTVIGKTLLYPLTVLILIILSRLDIFDNWVMTWSLGITFALGAVVLIGASLFLWWEGAKLRRAVLAQTRYPAERAAVSAVNDGVFAAWYNQPIFSAILSAAAVFGSLSVAGPLTRLFFAS
jgi:hypothetical protein